VFTSHRAFLSQRHAFRSRIWASYWVKAPLSQLPEVIVKLSNMVQRAGDIIMIRTPPGVAVTVAGDRLECEIEVVGRLVTIDRRCVA
jgi:hypothetical protein